MSSHYAFEYRPSTTLPALAWCATLTRGERAAVVRHGAAVETRPGFFVAGAWSGPFEAGGFAEATAFAGTGAQGGADGWRFATATQISDRLHVLRTGERLLISNSLVFALAEAGDGWIADYPWYGFDLRRFYREGPTEAGHRLRTASGNHLVLHDVGNLLIDENLRCMRELKQTVAAPGDFAACRATLLQAIHAVLANASATGRARPLPATAALSQGYDSLAIGALAREAGVEDAFTLRGAIRNGTDPVPREDSGRELGEALGFRVHEVDRTAWRGRPDLPETEFLSVPWGSSVALAAAEPHVQGRLVLGGEPGDDVWTLDPALLADNIVCSRSMSVTGIGPNEFRLRTGTVDFSPTYVLTAQAQAVFRVSHSAEMAPFRVGGSYDRPIARRMIEEAGLKRGTFASDKRPGAEPQHRRDDLSEAGRAAFETFLANSGWRGPDWRYRLLHHIGPRLNSAAWGALRLAGRRSRPDEGGLLVDGRWQTDDPAFGLRFQWCCETVRARYAAD